MDVPKTSVNFERVTADEFAFVAEAGDVQIGWCRKEIEGWIVRDTDEVFICGPFKSVEDARVHGVKALSPKAGSANPGW